MKFKKKPLVIEALQFTGSYESANQIIDWVNTHTPYFDPADATTWMISNYYGDISIRTPEGIIHAHAWDWVIKSLKDEFSVCKPGIFEDTYDPIASC